MKVLKDNYNQIEEENNYNQRNNPYPRFHICDKCGSELEYEKSDLRIGALGCAYLDCPLCGYDNMLENNESTITLTVDNIEFPTHFWHTSKENGAVEICNTRHIREHLKEAIKYFNTNKNEFVWFVTTGDLYMIVFKSNIDDGYEVMVTNNFYSTYIPFELNNY